MAPPWSANTPVERREILDKGKHWCAARSLLARLGAGSLALFVGQIGFRGGDRGRPAS